jgi:hypothetical protein
MLPVTVLTGTPFELLDFQDCHLCELNNAAPRTTFGSFVASVSDPDSESGSRMAKMTHKKILKVKKFHVSKCSMFSFESGRLLL